MLPTGSGTLAASHAAALIFGLAFWIVAARFYEAEDIGVAAAALAWANLASFVSALGMNYGLLRFLPIDPHPRSLLLSGVAVAAVASVSLGGASVVIMPPWELGLVCLIVTCATATVIVFLTDAASVAQGRPDLVLARNLVFGATRLAMLLALAGIGALGLVMSWTIGLVASLAAVSPRLWKVLPYSQAQPSWHAVRRLASFSVQSYAANIVSSLPVLMVPIVVLSVSGSHVAGLFAVPWQITASLAAVPTLLASALLAQGSRAKSPPLDLYRTVAPSVAVVWVGCLGVAVVSRPVLSLFGPQYSANPHWLGALMIWIALSAIVAEYQALERIRLRLRAILVTSLTSAFIATYLLLTLTQDIGPLGAAIALISGQFAIIPFAVWRMWSDSRSLPRPN